MYPTEKVAAKCVADKAITTLNERLNRALEILSYQCERIEAVLSRVNGTPQKAETNCGQVKGSRPTMPLQTAIETTESTASRLVDLVGDIERIA